MPLPPISADPLKKSKVVHPARSRSLLEAFLRAGFPDPNKNKS
jgi:hypothetical protein